MDAIYDLSGQDSETIIDAIIPSYGGTDGFVSVMDTLRLLSAGKRVRLVYPEASFVANVKIAESFF